MRSSDWKRSSTNSVSVSVRPGDLAGDDRDGAELAERAGGREDDAVGEAPADRRQRDPPEHLQAAGAERARRPAPGRCPPRAARAPPRAPRTAARRRSWPAPCPGVEKITYGRAEPAVAAPDEDQREADDDRRDRERQVDQRVEQRACRGTRSGRAARRQATPKTAFSGTAISVIMIVRKNACWAGGVVTASQAAADAVLERAVEDHPDRDDEQQRRGSRARRRAARGAAVIALLRPARHRTRCRAASTNEIASSSDRHRGGAGRVAALDLAEDEDGRDLGLVGQVAADQHDRAELADGAAERERRRRRGSPAAARAG